MEDRPAWCQRARSWQELRLILGSPVMPLLRIDAQAVAPLPARVVRTATGARLWTHDRRLAAVAAALQLSNDTRYKA